MKFIRAFPDYVPVTDQLGEMLATLMGHGPLKLLLYVDK